MVNYHLRYPFRIAAWIPALAFAFMGIAFGLLGIKELGRPSVWGAGLAVFGTLLTVLGFQFGKIAWTGRVSATVEEWGLDDPEDIERMRATARSQGRLDE